MARLTKDIKQLIIKNALNKAGIPDKEHKIMGLMSQLAEKVRVFALGGEEEAQRYEQKANEIEILIAILPRSIISSNNPIRYANYIRASFLGERIDLYFYEDIDRPRPIRKLSPCDRVDIPPNHPLIDAWHTLSQLIQDTDALRDTVSTKTQAIINSVNTDTQLTEVWPEAQTLLPSIVKTPQTLPTVCTSDLNKIIGLP